MMTDAMIFGKEKTGKTKKPLSDFALQTCRATKEKKDAATKEQEELALKLIEELEFKILEAAREGKTSVEIETQNYQPLPRKVVIHFEDLGFIVEANSYPMIFNNFEQAYSYDIKWDHLYEQFIKESET